MNKELLQNVKKIESTIVGRNNQTEKIALAFKHVLGGNNSIVIIKGEAGIGKTFLINHMIDNYFNDGLSATCFRGKYIQYSDESFTAIKEIIDNIFQHILILPNKQYKKIVYKLEKYLGNDLGYICFLSKLAKKTFKNHKKTSINDYKKSKYQIRKSIKNFIKCISELFFPLVIFVDDLQWADEETLDILNYIEKDELLNCLFILSYRNNTNNDSIMKLEKKATVIELEPLSEKHIEYYLIDVFKHNITNLDYLKRYIYSVTLGNPFYIKRVTESLLIDNILEYSVKDKQWITDINKLNLISVPKNVGQIIKYNLKAMNYNEKMFLDYLACLDGKATISQMETLLSLEKCEIESIANNLCEKCFIVPSVINIDETSVQTVYHFTHDIVLEYTYEDMEQSFIKSIHYKIAKIYADKSNTENGNTAFITYHFIRSDLDQWTQEEKKEWIYILCEIGEEALNISDYTKSKRIFSVCEAIISSSYVNYEDSFKIPLLLKLARCKYYLGECEGAELIFNELISQVEEINYIVQIKKEHMCMLAFVGRDKEVIKNGIKVLKLLGYIYNVSDLQNDIGKINNLYNEEFIANLTNNQNLDNNFLSVVLDILYQMMPSAQIINIEHFMYILVKIAVISAEDGYSKYSFIGYSASAYVFYNIINEKEKGKRISEFIMYNVTEKKDECIKLKAYAFLASFVCHWFNSIDKTIDLLESTSLLCIDFGQPLYLEYLTTSLMFALFLKGENLNIIKERLQEKISLIKDLDIKGNQFTNQFIEKTLDIHLGFLINGIDDKKYGFDFDDDVPDSANLMVYLWYRLQHVYILGDMDSAFSITESIKDELDRAKGHIVYTEVVFFSLLIRLEYHENLDKSEKDENIRYINKHLTFIEDVCEHYQDNHYARLLLVKGLYDSVFNDGIKTAGFYNQSILLVQKKENMFLEAIGNMLAFKFYKNHSKLARYYKQEACECYKKWGALYIAEQLEETKKYCENNISSELNNHGNDDFLYNFVKQIDKMDEKDSFIYFLSNLVKIDKCSYGAILFEKSDDMFLSYEKSSIDSVRVYDKPIKNSYKMNIEEKVVKYAFRTGEMVIVDDKAKNELFISNKHESKYSNISIICIPLKFFNIIIGMIYLEFNNQEIIKENILYKVNTLIPALLTKCERIKDINLNSISLKAKDNSILTSREVDILNEVSRGLSNLDVSKKEFISVGTVKSHLSSIYSKLGVDSRIKAVAKAKEINII